VHAALNPADEQRRCPAEHEHPPPSEVGADEVIGQCGEEESEIVARVHVPGAHLAAILRPLLSDERATDRLLAAKSDAATHAEHGELVIQVLRVDDAPVVELLVAHMAALGFIFVVLGRSELFTEQTTMSVLP